MPKNFASLKELADYLLTLEAIEQEKKQAALEEVGKYLKDKVQSKYGQYQDAVGPFPAWEPLTDATQQDRVRQGYEPDNPLYRSGEVAHSVDYNANPDRLEVGSPLMIALWEEFGTIHMPPRSTFGAAMMESLPEIKKIIGLMMYNWLTGEK